MQSLDGRRIQDIGRSVALRLKDKYSAELLDGYIYKHSYIHPVFDYIILHHPSSQYWQYLNDLRSQFFLKRLHRPRLSTPNRGRIYLSYVFVDSSDDFEHLQLPGNISQTTPTTSEGGVATAEREAESETELPPGWEERRVS